MKLSQIVQEQTGVPYAISALQALNDYENQSVVATEEDKQRFKQSLQDIANQGKYLAYSPTLREWRLSSKSQARYKLFVKMLPELVEKTFERV